MSDSYLGNPTLKKAGIKINFTEDQIREYHKCSKDPEYFIENYMKIVSVDRGLINFGLYPYQRKMVRTFKDNRFSICKMPRQSGKSTTVTGYMLWLILFHDNQSIAILANKGSLARDMLSKIQLAYEHIPKWMQQGIVIWNKGNIELENGSKVLASATSASAIRGGSYNCVTGDSSITLRVDGRLITMTIEEAFDIFNTNSSINTSNHKRYNDVFSQQIHKMVFFDHRKCESSSASKASTIYGRETSYNTDLYRRDKRQNKHSEFNSQRAYFGASSFTQDGYLRRPSPSAAICLYEDDERSPIQSIRNKKESWDDCISTSIDRDIGVSKEKDVRKESVLAYQGKDVSIIIGKKAIGSYESFDFTKKQREIERGIKAKRVWQKDIRSVDWDEKNTRACDEDKSKSRKDKKDGRKASWYEAFCRGKGQDVREGKRQDTLEQRVEILTAEGFKSFDGIRKSSLPKKVITVTTSSGMTVRCTPDHKIQTTEGMIPAFQCIGKHAVTLNGQDEITSVSGFSHEYVYDCLEVDDVHSFIANGISVSNCIFLDEFAFVPRNIAEEFFASVYPTISSGKTSKIIVVSTPNGLNHYYKMWVDATEKRSEYVPIEVHWKDTPGRDDKWREQTIRNTSEEQFKQEFETEFLGSTLTLISGTKLRSMAFKNVSKDAWGVDIYHQPEYKHTYAIIVDTGHGVGLDYSAFTVIDVSQVPYRLVAKYKNNTVVSSFYPEIIARYAKAYNNAYVLVETNDIGKTVAETLHRDLECDNVLWTTQMGRAGQQLSAGFSGRSQLGVTTSRFVKAVGCSSLKELIEGDKLIIEDFDTIEELSNFVSKGSSYEAEEGYNDDLVMTLVLFGWLAKQLYFKELTDIDIRHRIAEEKLREMDEDLLPVGFYDDGSMDDPMALDGSSGDGEWLDRWIRV